MARFTYSGDLIYLFHCSRYLEDIYTSKLQRSPSWNMVMLDSFYFRTLGWSAYILNNQVIFKLDMSQQKIPGEISRLDLNLVSLAGIARHSWDIGNISWDMGVLATTWRYKDLPPTIILLSYWSIPKIFWSIEKSDENNPQCLGPQKPTNTGEAVAFFSADWSLVGETLREVHWNHHGSRFKWCLFPPKLKTLKSTTFFGASHRFAPDHRVDHSSVISLP